MQDITSYIKDKTYPGRGIFCGLTEDGNSLVNGYFIMGRSENSRNRVFLKEGDNVKIKPFDESKVEDPSLIIYYPVKSIDGKLIVTNGDQTDTIYDYIKDGKTFEEGLFTREFEPDSPNFTPRISSITYLQGSPRYTLSILKARDEHASSCSRFFFNYQPKKGLCHIIHTYKDDGNPLPSFAGEPVELQLKGEINQLAESIYNSLNEDNKISLYIRFTDVDTLEYKDVIINKNGR